MVFPQDKVSQIAITIDHDNWAAMQADMTDLFGPQGTAESASGGAAPGARGKRQPNGGAMQAFDAAVAQLKAFVAQRATVVDAFLAGRN